MGNDNNRNNFDEEIHSRDDFHNEIANEFAEPHLDNQFEQKEVDSYNVVGWIAVALSIISFFAIPIVFAGASIILGFIAQNRRAKVLGYTAIVISIISLIVRFLIMPVF